MRKKELLQFLRNHINSVSSDLMSKINDNELIFGYNNDYCELKIRFKCVNYGQTNVLKRPLYEIRLIEIEKNIKSLLSPALQIIYQDDFTLSTSFVEVFDFPILIDEKILNVEDAKRYGNLLFDHLKKIEDSFIKGYVNIFNVGKYISHYEFSEHSKVLVGNKFPIHVLKKLYLLGVTNCNDRFIEYKNGVKELLKLYSDRYPDKKELSDDYLNNLNTLIEHFKIKKI